MNSLLPTIEFRNDTLEMLKEFYGRYGTELYQEVKAHNYTGCIDLSISYYLWLLARAHSDLDVDFPFDRFSTLYLKEIVECPPPVWDAAQHPRLHSFIFDETWPASERVPETVAHVSNRLVLLYADKIAPLVPFMKGGDVDSPDPDFRAAASSYFISGPECTALMARYNTTGANEDDIRYFIEYAGIAAVLWQMRRYLANEPEAFQAQLDQWLTAVLPFERHLLTGRGQVKMDQRVFDHGAIKSVGLLLTGEQQGDFELQLKYVKAVVLGDEYDADPRQGLRAHRKPPATVW